MEKECNGMDGYWVGLHGSRSVCVESGCLGRVLGGSGGPRSLRGSSLTLTRAGAGVVDAFAAHTASWSVLGAGGSSSSASAFLAALTTFVHLDMRNNRWLPGAPNRIRIRSPA